MPIKAKRLATKKGIKASLSSSGSKFAQRVPDEGIEVRFLTEPEDFWAVEIHYGNKESFPCTGADDGCIGCEEGFDKGQKWYANVYWPDEDRVVVFEMGKSVFQALMKKYDRYNTVMDRNYEVTKEGTGQQTRYDMEALDKTHIKGIDRMEPVDLEQFFKDWLKRAMSDMGEDEVISSRGNSHRRGAPSAGSRSRTRGRRQELDDEEDDFEDDEDDFDEDEEDAKPVKAKRPTKTSNKRRTTATKTTRPTTGKRRSLRR